VKIFRNSTLDLFLVLYAMVAFALPFLIATYTPLLWWFILAPFQIVFAVIVMNTSMHHHMHVPIFRPKFLNRAYEIFISAAVGIPFHGWKYYHTIHHKHNNDFSVDGRTWDPVSFYRFGTEGKRENIWSYCFKGVLRDLSSATNNDPDDTCHIKRGLNVTPELRLENRAFHFYMICLAFVNVWYAVFYVFVYLLMLAANNANSYGEHYGPVEQSNFRANSVGSYGKWYNILCFNSGYHQEHHVRPSAHWTVLPTITSTLPTKRHTINTMYMFNGPWKSDLVDIIKGVK